MKLKEAFLKIRKSLFKICVVGLMILINRLKHNYLIMFYNKKYNNWEDISSDVSFLS